MFMTLSASIGVPFVHNFGAFPWEEDAFGWDSPRPAVSLDPGSDLLPRFHGVASVHRFPTYNFWGWVPPLQLRRVAVVSLF